MRLLPVLFIALIAAGCSDEATAPTDPEDGLAGDLILSDIQLLGWYFFPEDVEDHLQLFARRSDDFGYQEFQLNGRVEDLADEDWRRLNDGFEPVILRFNAQREPCDPDAGYIEAFVSFSGNNGYGVPAAGCTDEAIENAREVVRELMAKYFPE